MFAACVFICVNVDDFFRCLFSLCQNKVSHLMKCLSSTFQVINPTKAYSIMNMKNRLLIESTNGSKSIKIYGRVNSFNAKMTYLSWECLRRHLEAYENKNNKNNSNKKMKENVEWDILHISMIKMSPARLALFDFPLIFRSIHSHRDWMIYFLLFVTMS